MKSNPRQPKRGDVIDGQFCRIICMTTVDGYVMWRGSDIGDSMPRIMTVNQWHQEMAESLRLKSIGGVSMPLSELPSLQ